MFVQSRLTLSCLQVRLLVLLKHEKIATSISQDLIAGLLCGVIVSKENNPRRFRILDKKIKFC